MLCPSSLRHVFYRCLPFWDAWDWGRAFHFLLAGIGMILLLREAGVSAFGALLGAVAISFSSQMVVWIHSDVIASGCCWSPWMLWSLFRLRRLAETSVGNRAPPTRIRMASAVLIAGAFTGTALRCGFLHTALFNLTLLVIFLLSEIALRRGENRYRHWIPFVVAVAIGLAVSAPWFASVVPPALDGGHPLHHRSILSGIKAFPTLVTAFIPTILGSPQSLDGFKAFGGDFYEVKSLVERCSFSRCSRSSVEKLRGSRNCSSSCSSPSRSLRSQRGITTVASSSRRSAPPGSPHGGLTGKRSLNRPVRGGGFSFFSERFAFSGLLQASLSRF
jgi:hypothetical protein